MSLFGFDKDTVTLPNNSKNVLVDYQRLRSVGVRLNNKLVSRLSRDALYEGAKKLGFLRGGKFVFENKDESSVLMDYCIYNVFRQGRNAIDEYISECAADHDSDEMACLHAMQHATYVLRRCARQGARCRLPCTESLYGRKATAGRRWTFEND